MVGAAKLASLEGHELLQTTGARDGCAGAMAERARGEEAERSLAERLVDAASGNCDQIFTDKVWLSDQYFELRFFRASFDLV